MTLRSINPATLEVILETEELAPAQLEEKLAAADGAAAAWKHTTFAKRSVPMKKAAALLRAERESLARIITSEVGKTLAASLAEIEKCASVCDYYADNAERFLQTEIVATEGGGGYVRFEPLGVVLAVMPWNFPLWQVFRFAAPALMAGNAGVLKHASNVQASARAIERVFSEAGFPSGLFSNLAVGSSRVADIIRDPRIKAVTLTGSEKAGSSVASVAGAAIKKTVLELGGSDPFIVLPDADLAKAVSTAVSVRLQSNAGQSCIAAKRFIVHESVVKEFSDMLVGAVGLLRLGDPLAPDTTVGPLANEQMVTDAKRQVAESVARGARVLAGGARPDRKGYFYLPTVLANVQKGMPVYDEEVFAPILPILACADEDDAVRIANDTAYGLSATIFSRDVAHAKQLAERIESGSVFINNHVKSDPRFPFGGVKKSGYGRELSHYGIKEFVNIKAVSVAV